MNTEGIMAIAMIIMFIWLTALTINVSDLWNQLLADNKWTCNHLKDIWVKLNRAP